MTGKEDDWLLEVIDAEAAFLEADLDKSMYIERPTGMVELGFITEDEKREYVIE